MIKDKNSADKVNQIMLNVSKELSQSLIDLQNCLSEDEFKEYKLAVGKVMGEILLEIMNPIYKEHPELTPEELKS